MDGATPLNGKYFPSGLMILLVASSTNSKGVQCANLSPGWTKSVLTEIYSHMEPFKVSVWAV
jgi:hypothetical protein